MRFRSRAARRRNCMSSAACACRSDSHCSASSASAERGPAISAAFAASADSEARIAAITQSRCSIVRSRPSRMSARSRALLEVELAAAPDHLAAVVEERLERFLEADRLRLPVDEREHVDGEGRLQRGELEQLRLDGRRRAGARDSAITIRMPSRSDSSRRSETPSMRLLRTRSAMRWISVDLLTW